MKDHLLVLLLLLFFPARAPHSASALSFSSPRPFQFRPAAAAAARRFPSLRRGGGGFEPAARLVPDGPYLPMNTAAAGGGSEEEGDLDLASDHAARRIIDLSPAARRFLSLRGGAPAKAPGFLPSAEDELKLAELVGRLINGEASGTQPVIKQYSFHRADMYFRFTGTILQRTWKECAMAMLGAFAVIVAFRQGRPERSMFLWRSGHREAIQTAKWFSQLAALDKLWHYQMTLTTFVLTFFLNKAFDLWRRMYRIGRRIQGRLNDLGLILATHAERDGGPRGSGGGGKVTPRAASAMAEVARLLRAFQILMYGGCLRQYGALVTDRGIAELARVGLLRDEEVLTLTHPNNRLPVRQRHNAVLEWAIIHAEEAMASGAFENVDRTTFTTKVCELRATYAQINDELEGRLPLAYSHFVQLLVDVFLVMTPFCLFEEMGGWAIPASGLLTLFYQGLFNLGKIFLDPYNNDEQKNGDPMIMETMIIESNAGSLRWLQGVENYHLPKTAAS